MYFKIGICKQVLPGTFKDLDFMKIRVFSALELVIFEFLKEYFF